MLCLCQKFLKCSDSPEFQVFVKVRTSFASTSKQILLMRFWFEGHSVVSDKEAKLLLKGNDELILSVYDYWIDKRLRLKQSLIPIVKSDKRDLVRLKEASRPGSTEDLLPGGLGCGIMGSLVADWPRGMGS